MIKNNQNKKQVKNRGSLILQAMIFGSVAIVIINALASFAATSIKLSRLTHVREQAFQSAEAGVDYYRWHLAHAVSDYQDGTGAAGPYVHTLSDKDGNPIGQFSLEITPPTSGSSIVSIKSTGTSSLDSTQTRKLSTRVAMPSIAENAFAGNDNMRFGEGTVVYGPIKSNGGIRFDGYAHNIVSSATATYYDPDDASNCGGNNTYGVHTCVGTNDPAYPTTLPNRPDVFGAGRLMSQPEIDFSGFTADIGNLKIIAQTADGFYRAAAGAGFVGYHIVLKTNDTFDLYKINSWASIGSSCDDGYTTSSWSVGTQTLQGNYAFPTNGVIFIQDHVVIDGQVNTGRLTIVAALLPEPASSQYKNIIINNDLIYTNTDGTDSIGLVAQGGVMVGLVSEDDLRIHGALMAQHNAVGRFSYNGNSSCIYKTRNTITLYGMIASYARYGFAYTNGTGYTNRNINYDANLLYAPPPSFPLTSNQYQILSWQEVK
ncbi:MAG: hypothetical protein KBD17_02305 [Candidatus Pacebacteria bacterium]|nr:hypothetical protein [Candidatus Paceibacterota bacterium]